MFFGLNSWLLALVLAGILFGATFLGLAAGRSLSHHRETLREPFGVVQAALLTLVGLILAFGLAMAVGRYESRRAAVVERCQRIGTAYLRAQTLREPVRSLALPLYPRYTDESIRLGQTAPGSNEQRARDRGGVRTPAPPLELWRVRRSLPNRVSRRPACMSRA